MFHTHFVSTAIEAREFMDFAIKKIDETFALYELLKAKEIKHGKTNMNFFFPNSQKRRTTTNSALAICGATNVFSAFCSLISLGLAD